MANKASLRITFTNVSCSGTWIRTGTVVTVTFTDHEMVNGQVINVTEIDGDQVTGNETITRLTDDTFSFEGVNSGDTSGTITYIRGTGDELVVGYHDAKLSTFDNFTLVSNTVGGQGYFNIGTSNESCAANFAAALIRDYGPNGLISQNNISATVDYNDVTIYALYYSTEEYGNIDYFEDSDAIWHDMTNTTEVLPADILSISEVTYSEAASSPTTNIRRTLTVANAVYPIQITSPVSKSCANAGELWFDHARSWAGVISITDSSPETTTIGVFAVQQILDVTANVIYGSGYANIRLTPQISTEVQYESISIEYSLDDVTYQPGNTFYGLLVGDYTGYIKDQYGGSKTVSVSITSIPDDSKPDPYFDISFNQSFQFREQLIRDYDVSFPNMFDDLYCENEFVNRAFKAYNQKFKYTDQRNIQIRSTYETVNVDVYSIDDTETSLDTITFSKRIQNIGLKDSRDCLIKYGGDNKTYLYFTSGNTYDYDTGVASGTYNLSGSLEYWMTKEYIQNIQISGSSTMNGQYEIIGYDYDTSINASVLVIGSTYTGTPNESCIAKIIYNSEDWDIYEALVSMDAYGEGTYFMTLEASDADPRYEAKSYISEPFEIIQTIKTDSGSGVVSDDLVLIKWADDEVVNDVDFRTGIENGIRIEGTFYDYSPSGEKEVFDDDNGDIFPLKATKKRIITLKTHDLPPYLIDLIATAISEHKYVLINGIQVQTKDYPSVESIDGGSTQTLSIDCQIMNTTTYVSNDITGENTNYNVLGITYSTKKVLGLNN